MPRDLTLATRLRAADLNVVEVAGWQTRGSETFHPRGWVDHHTAGPSTGNAPSLGICINGRSDLPGPLCNVFTARDNTVFVVASGRANHAGQGGWRGLSGNSTVWGNERENDGRQAWRPDQTETACQVAAAIMRGRVDAAMFCEHKEWAPGRKPDAHTVAGAAMRARVAELLADRPPTRDVSCLADFSFKPRPTPEQLRHHAGVVVYLSDDLRKVCSPAEVRAYLGAGLTVNFVGQDGKTDWQGGFEAGKAKVVARNAQADALGAPSWLPIIHTLQDSALTVTDYPVVAEYVRGLLSVRGRPVGRYGGGRLFDDLDRVFRTRPFAISWLSAATSWGSYPEAHLQQHAGATHHPILGVATDDNTILRPFPRWGQATHEEDDLFTDADRARLGQLDARLERLERRSLRQITDPAGVVYLTDGLTRMWIVDEAWRLALADWFGFVGPPEPWDRAGIDRIPLIGPEAPGVNAPVPY